MGSFGENENLEYVICLNSCDCKMFNEGLTTYEVIKRGCLAKIQYRNCGQNSSVRTLVTNESEVYMPDYLQYISIDLKLFKYLNAINDFEERVKFYNNEERRVFVLHLVRNSVVSAGFSSGKQTKAVFQEINENESKILITVELLEKPFKYSLPANMVNTIAYFDSIHKDNRGWFEKCLARFCCSCYLEPNFDYSALEHWRYYDNVQNGTTSNVSRGKPVSYSVEPANKNLISQNLGGPGQQENYHDPHTNQMLEGNTKRDENSCETQVGSDLTIPSSKDTSLFSETPITPLKNNTHITNEADLPDSSKIAVRPNISASKCIICKNLLDISEGFVLILCKHTFCETCIKKQINMEMLAQTNITPCCDRSVELNEIKYFLPAHEYEQFKESYKQQCFDKNCSGYHLWKDCGEDKERPNTFTCNKCELENCLKCGTIHVNLTCEQYDKITGERNSVDNETVQMFLIWIREGKAMNCPKCEALIEKDEGCDWIQCRFCDIEICWATRGPRWGPDGKGDTSGGCGCDFKIKKCVENCNNCH